MMTKKTLTLEGSSVEKYTSVIETLHKAVFPDLALTAKTVTDNFDKVVEYLQKHSYKCFSLQNFFI